MLQVETTQIFDATKYLSCATCPLHNNCNKYALICNFVNNKLFFGASLLCVLERAENATMNVLAECKKNNFSNPLQRAETLYKDFLPTLNNFLNAFYKYDCENASDYDKQALIFALAESLEYWHLLQHFDFMFSQDVENTRDILHSQFEYEITKSENEKLAEEKARGNNTTKGE